MASPADPPRFVLLGELASGGMGYIDLARMTDASGERVVAMKRVHPQFSRDAEFVRMFRDEIWLTQGLHHPNVVELVGWGEDEDGPYLVMELVDGAPLAEITYRAKRKGRRLPDELVAYIAARVADGLHAAHTLGIVHRDITPSNVLIGFDGSIKITDFGIAKAAASGSHTRTGVVKGKIEYMSPEHALRRAVDGRSDLYSLGVVVFEAMRGDPPIHGGSDLDLLKRVAYEPLPPLASVVPDANPELAQLVDRLLAKSPDDRPPDGASVARELDAWLEARRLRPRAIRAKLAEHAERFGAARRRRVQKLLTAEGLEVGSSASWRDPKRARSAAAPGPGTFRRLDSGGTRSVAAAGSPPLAPPLPAIVEPAVASAEPLRAEPERGSTRRVITMPPPPIVEVGTGAQPAVMPAGPPARPRWVPALAGVAVACVLVGFVVLVSVRASRSDSPSESAIEAVPQEPRAPPSPAIEIAPPPDLAPEPDPAPAPPPPLESAREPAASTSAPQPKPAAPRAGQPRPRTTKVPKPRSSPCTPDSFDYPACR